MKHEIDIFDIPGFANNHRWDLRQNAEMVNIVYGIATFGNFLKYFIERFSRKTPPMEQEPFNNIGTSHAISKKDYSGLVQKYHPSFINDNLGQKDLPICLIVPSRRKHFLYLKKAEWFRSGDHKISPDELWQKPLQELPSLLRDGVANEIMRLYGITNKDAFRLPKFLVRDFYKLEFLLSLEGTYHHRWYEEYRNHQFFRSQKTFQLDLEAFFDWNCFIKSIKELDTFFDLDIDFSRQSIMKELLEKALSLDVIRLECNKVEDILARGTEHDLENLCVTSEAYLYAEMEKKYPTIQMPLTNRFFRDFEEIRQFLEHFPNWYRRPNPNLPGK